MHNSKTTAGILSMATYIPRAYHDADYIASQCDTPAEIIRTKLGWYQKNVPGPGDGTVAMGLKAARKALYYSGLEPDQIDLVIYSGEEVKEYRNWPVGPKIQKELGLNRAWSFDLQQRCGTTLVALQTGQEHDPGRRGFKKHPDRLKLSQLRSDPLPQWQGALDVLPGGRRSRLRGAARLPEE